MEGLQHALRLAVGAVLEHKAVGAAHAHGRPPGQLGRHAQEALVQRSQLAPVTGHRGDYHREQRQRNGQEPHGEEMGPGEAREDKQKQGSSPMIVI